jgi:hypothetical protein
MPAITVGCGSCSVPTRSILVLNQPYATTGKPIEAFVSANCQIGAGGGKL